MTAGNVVDTKAWLHSRRAEIAQKRENSQQNFDNAKARIHFAEPSHQPHVAYVDAHTSGHTQHNLPDAAKQQANSLKVAEILARLGLDNSSQQGAKPERYMVASVQHAATLVHSPVNETADSNALAQG